MSDDDSAVDIFQQCLAGGVIDKDSPSWREVEGVVADNAQLLHSLNSQPPDLAFARHTLSLMTLRPIDPTLTLATPFRCDFGRHLFLGRHVFINTDCLFVDLGGLHLSDHVQVGPRVTILTVNHPLDPAKRRSVQTAAVRVERGAWIGAGATIVPGVTVGENAVVAAGAVVTKDVPANTVVAGVPARVIKQVTASASLSSVSSPSPPAS